MTNKEVLDMINEALEQPYSLVILKHTGLNELKRVVEEAQKQEKLLELYEKLAVYRLVVVGMLLDEITDLTHFDFIKEFIEFYGDEDIKIVEEIAKTKEV